MGLVLLAAICYGLGLEVRHSRGAQAVWIAICLVVASCQVTDASSHLSSSTTTYVPYPDWLEDMRWKYRLYRWPELRQLERDSSLNSLVKTSEDMDSVYRLSTSIDVFRVTTFCSPYLKSRYYLIYIQSNWSMLGAFVPRTCFIKEIPGSRRLIPLDSQEMVIGRMEPTSGRTDLDWSAGISEVARDCRTEIIRDSVEALQAAVDMVSVVCGDQPVVFINSIYDIFEFSNCVAGDLFWDEAAKGDTIPKLLSAFRIRDIRDNRYLVGNYVSISYDSALFSPYERAVSPASVVSENGQCFYIHLFTWSPCNGSLVAWSIAINRYKGVSITYKYIADDVGFRFSSPLVLLSSTKATTSDYRQLDFDTQGA